MSEAMMRTARAAEILRETVGRLEKRHASALEVATADVSKIRGDLDELRGVVAALKLQRGEPGERGERGLPGRDGVDGERGPAGKDGRDGEVGKSGAPGERGERGHAGIQGPPGEIGKAGPTGQPGERGERGERGEKGDRGERGESGRDGKDGRDGRNGVDGNDGRDAAQIEVLDGIVEGRSYARGTWATRDGGLWRFSGHEWSCIVRGVKEVETRQVDDRSFEVRTVFSDGEERVVKMAVNSIVYHDVWEAKGYAIGDCVTWDGGLWIARSEASLSDKPGESSAWRLAVKRGRNGKSA